MCVVAVGMVQSGLCSVLSEGTNLEFFHYHTFIV